MNCSACTAETFQAKDGLCKGCRLRALVARRQKFRWTPDADAALRRVYQAKNKSTLTRELDALARRLGFPRYIVANRAQRLGLRTFSKQAWTEAELEQLRELAGEMPRYKIGQRLGRSESSVANKLFLLGLESRCIDGFSVNELGQLLGIHHRKIEGWISQRLLVLNDEYRVTYASVARFLWNHMEKYRFAACDEWWLKTMLNPKTGTSRVQSEARKEAA